MEKLGTIHGLNLEWHHQLGKDVEQMEEIQMDVKQAIQIPLHMELAVIVTVSNFSWSQLSLEIFESRKINANILENYQEQNANCSEPIIFIPPCNGDIFRHFGHCATLMV